MRSGDAWDYLSPAARSWFVRQPWSGRVCSTTRVDVETRVLQIQCGSTHLRIGFNTDCSMLVKLMEWTGLAWCDRPRLALIVVTDGLSPWDVVFYGEPLTP